MVGTRKEHVFSGTWGSTPPCSPLNNVQHVPWGDRCKGQKLGRELCPHCHFSRAGGRRAAACACGGNPPACMGSVHAAATVSGGPRDDSGDTRVSPGLGLPDSSPPVALLLPCDTPLHLFPGPLSPAPHRLPDPPCSPRTPALLTVHPMPSACFLGCTKHIV